MKTVTRHLSSKLLVFAFCVMAFNSHAHHSFSATFNVDEEITISGTITDFSFRNPHVIIKVDVINNDGSVTNWLAEGSSATGWRRVGWSAELLQIGEQISITGNATKDGSAMVSIENFGLLEADGVTRVEELSDDKPPTSALRADTSTSTAEQEIFTIPLTLATGEPNFTGTTLNRRGLIEGISGGPDSNDPVMPYNKLGQAAHESQEWSIDNDPQIFCDPPGMVRQAGYTPYGFKLAQYSDHITIEYEEYGSKRSIFFDDELPKPGLRSRLGDSVARYEGDSLIIETVNLTASLSGHRGKPLSDEARVTEVYTRLDNPKIGSIVATETTVVDPKFLTEPWTIKRYKLYSKDYEFIENECTQPLRERPANVFQYSDFDQQFLK